MNRFALRRIVDLNAKAEQLEGLGSYEKSISAREEVCRLLETHWGSNHIWRISRLLDLAGTYKLKGDIDRAEKLYCDAIRLLKERSDDGQTFQDLARGLNSLGVLYCESERLNRGIELFEQALPISEGGHHQLARAAILNNLAGAHHTLGHFARASTCYLEVLEIYTRAGDGWLLEQAHCHCDLAELAADAENQTKSDMWAQDAQVLYRKALSRVDPAFGQALIRLGCLCQRLQQPMRALSLLEEAAVIFQQSEDYENELSQCLDLMSELRQTLVDSKR